MNERTVATSVINGCFALPIGISFRHREVGKHPSIVEVSTVCLEGGHLEDPLGICSPEHGYETMIFLDGCTFFSLFTANYKTRKEALAGHRSIIRKLLSGKLSLAIPLNYHAFGMLDQAAQSVKPEGSAGNSVDHSMKRRRFAPDLDEPERKM